MIGIGKPKTSASSANQAVFRTAMPSSGSARTRAKLSSPTNVGSRDEVRLLHAHHERPDDREPREDAEDDQERQQERRACSARRAGHAPSGGSAALRRHGRLRQRASCRHPCRRSPLSRALAGRTMTARPVSARAAAGPWGRGPHRPDADQPLSRIAWTWRVGGVEQRVDVRVLVGEHRLHDGVERGVQVLGVGRRLSDERLVEDLRRERGHLGRRAR